MLGLNVQPNTLVHHAMVAPGSVLARSVCVMYPSRPRVGTCRAGDDFDGFFGTFLTGLCLVRCGFFFMAVGDGYGGNLAALNTVRNEAPPSPGWLRGFEEILRALVQHIHAGAPHVAQRGIRSLGRLRLSVGAHPRTPEAGGIAKATSEQLRLCAAAAIGRHRCAEPEPGTGAAHEQGRPRNGTRAIEREIEVPVGVPNCRANDRGDDRWKAEWFGHDLLESLCVRIADLDDAQRPLRESRQSSLQRAPQLHDRGLGTSTIARKQALGRARLRLRSE